ncbi:hypothetical protein KSF_043010 [Reticulibacter mediterranei]|uniref:Uncharacterized protein n=1 Tax=Reticulibacter mediterranei TaxID=2778369 RepID=A0A8J3N3D5_9CHLR|nr:hypothetical protein KSF_043010 [Reticulibacter mediterranei]
MLSFLWSALSAVQPASGKVRRDESVIISLLNGEQADRRGKARMSVRMALTHQPFCAL